MFTLFSYRSAAELGQLPLESLGEASALTQSGFVVDNARHEDLAISRLQVIIIIIIIIIIFILEILKQINTFMMNDGNKLTMVPINVAIKFSVMLKCCLEGGG